MLWEYLECYNLKLLYIIKKRQIDIQSDAVLSLKIIFYDLPISNY